MDAKSSIASYNAHYLNTFSIYWYKTMRSFICVLALLIAQASAFSVSSSRASRVSLQMAGDKSKALPFLPRPAKLDGSAPV
jgi:hypothetical protein